MSSPTPSPTPSLTRRAARRLGHLALTIGFVIAVWMAASSLIGFHRYVITGGSMTGSIAKGSLVYDRTVPTSSLKVGDVITYEPPKTAGPHGLVTHRIVWIGRDRVGRLAFRTKGDANAAPDAWKFTLGPTNPRVVFSVPYAGYVLTELSGRRARMLLIGLPALLIALSVLAGLWADAGREAERERERPGGLKGAA